MILPERKKMYYYIGDKYVSKRRIDWVALGIILLGAASFCVLRGCNSHKNNTSPTVNTQYQR